MVLIALGLWTDGSGRREILDWQIAESESQAEWEKLLQRLWERGLSANNGLKLILRDGGEGLGEAFDYLYGGEVIEQRCIFHKLRNLRQNFKRGGSRKSDPKA